MALLVPDGYVNLGALAGLLVCDRCDSVVPVTRVLGHNDFHDRLDAVIPDENGKFMSPKTFQALGLKNALDGLTQ